MSLNINDTSDQPILYSAINPTYNDIEAEPEHGQLLYQASFEEESFVRYHVMILFIVALCALAFYGIGLLFLLYLPIHAYVSRKDAQSRRLYITTESVIYKRAPPVPFCPCFGTTVTEKHTLLPLITDVIIVQGCLQAKYGLFSLIVSNAGRVDMSKTAYGIHIDGIKNPGEFKRVLLMVVIARRSGRIIRKKDVEMLLRGEESNTTQEMTEVSETKSSQIVVQMQKNNETLEVISKLFQERKNV